ncbi:O-acetyltransferase OatA [Legionella massiliensis]|uniref:O-acetyltransferase OatA n=1 Tax=Legionella massiliensis TaxID=1034943 RepID=A0A078KZG7_9GAMM|nr:acyltransferase family protein [Legionella massiliensis]CDZ77143.1 O-acetyltransferase OatA [Legionella massiliensis]CEE12881.1 O-acetyltransferase OatA [Legionella massiliensis]
MERIRYREDINGLRGIAVLAVLFFHLNLGILPGGYVGVDVFFVISGYLISSIIYREILNNRFSLTTFYERRAKRILPALFSTILLCSLMAYWQLFPIELVSFAKSVMASALFSANIYFYSSLGYFSPAADEIPLLHLWSLGIEEQFYILFPFLLMFLARKSFKVLVITIISCLVISLILSQWMLYSRPTAAFYLLPFRAFELLIGSLVAIGQLPRLSGKQLPFIVSATGFGGILYAIFLFNPQTRFPGFAALLPCIGTALVIWAGEQACPLLNKMISINPWRWVGNISYSLYLMHWPVIVFTKRFYPHTEHFIYPVIVITLSFILAYLNYTFIEQRFRHLRPQLNPQKVLAGSAALIFLVALTSSLTIYKHGFPDKRNKRLNKILAYVNYDYKPGYHYGTCFLDENQNPDQVDIADCLPQEPQNKSAILWGDSHAAHLYEAFKENLATKGYSTGLLSASACPPIIDMDVTARPYCRRFNEIAFANILKIKPKILILSAIWFADPHTMDMLEKTIQRLAKEKIQIVILGISPIYKANVPLLIANFLVMKIPMQPTKDMLDVEFLARTDKIMLKRFGGRNDIQYISIMDSFCSDYICPLMTKAEVPLYYDGAHFTAAGSKLVVKELSPLILGA